MEHNYKLTDFNIVRDTDPVDILERIISINLWDVSELPICIIQRLETLINKMISDHEKEYDTILPLEDKDLSELGISINLDTKKKNLDVIVFIRYLDDSENIDGIHAQEIISPADKDYSAFKGYFLSGLKNYFHEQFERIQGCMA